MIMSIARSDKDFLVYCIERLINGKTLAFFEKQRIYRILESL